MVEDYELKDGSRIHIELYENRHAESIAMISSVGCRQRK